MFKYDCVIAMFFISLWLFAGSASAQGEPIDLGEICFAMVEDTHGSFKPPEITTGRLGILSYGPNHTLLNGTDGSYGTAIFGSGNFIVRLNTSYNSDDSSVSWFSSIYMVVNPETLSGTYKTMIVQTDPTPGGISSGNGSVNFFVCQ